ncbi:MAG: tRNA epoxyqueuosine(34) reductase QueG [Bacteroidales bacterium]
MLKERIKEASGLAGFCCCGIAAAEQMTDAEERFRLWLAEGNHAAMKYLERDPTRRFNPAMAVPGARSVIMLALPYGDAESATANTSGIAMYAWGEDYHHRLPVMGEPIMEILKDADSGGKSKFFTDSGFMPERSLAVKAGLGWIGKNGTLITPSHGSMVYLAAIVTTMALLPDQPFTANHCGECTLCMEACPTNAIMSPGLVNARNCIAYHTNSSNEPTIPEAITSRMNGQIYGCDICQAVCPWNNRSRLTNRREYRYPEHWPKHPTAWADKDEKWFQETFGGSALEDTGFKRMMRNVDAVLQRDSSGDSPQANAAI